MVEPPPSWDASGACQAGSGEGSLDPAGFTVANGETVTCSFHLTERAVVSLVKSQAGVEPESPFSFELRSGASIDHPGVVVASGESGAGGVVTFLCREGFDPSLCVELEVEGATEARFPPGSYQLCETAILPGWNNDLDGFIPGEDDSSTECVDVALEAGLVAGFAVDNTPPPGGLGHQTAFWKNWSSCGSNGNQDPILDETLALFPGGGTLIGALFVDACEEAVPLLETNALDGTSRSNDLAFRLAAELLAANLNERAGALVCNESVVAFADSQGLLADLRFDGAGWFLDGNDPAAGHLEDLARGFEQTLHQYNSNQLCDRDGDAPAPELLLSVLILPAVWIAAGSGRGRRRGRAQPMGGEGQHQ